jgi:hypothetical protein
MNAARLKHSAMIASVATLSPLPHATMAWGFSDRITFRKPLFLAKFLSSFPGKLALSLPALFAESPAERS